MVGGLGRTFHYGDFHFDVGPHRFHTENPRVAAFIREILLEEAIEIPRKSGARMFGSTTSGRCGRACSRPCRC